MDQEALATGPMEDIQDLGLGRTLSDQGQRMLNRDGSFNVVRHGMPFLRSFSPYHALVTVSWPGFYAVVITAYLVANLVFASAYLLCGKDALEGASGGSVPLRFVDCFFFSVQTIATIGYGRLNPVSVGANILVAVEAFVGLLGFAMATALAFARFSMPKAQILFSERAVIAPYRKMSAFEFRIINERKSQLIEVECKVMFSRMEVHEGRKVRRFHPLRLEREKVAFFPIQWVIVHPIDAESPLLGATAESLEASRAEFLILLTGTEETFTQIVHARSSYRYDEIVVGARFKSMYEHSEDGVVKVDMRRFHAIEPAELP